MYTENNHSAVDESNITLDEDVSTPAQKAKTTLFEDWDLKPGIKKALQELGFKAPTPIQNQTIPIVLKGRDMIGQAQTGSGKTGAYLIPAIERMETPAQAKTGAQLLILAPTRELARQIVDECHKFSKFLSLNVVSVVGGESMMRQVELINRGASIVVATPGRLLDHIRSKRLPRFQPKMVVLDEADEMLAMGFIEDVKLILQSLPASKQTVLFSATMPPAILKLAREQLREPQYVQLVQKSDQHQDIEKRLYVMEPEARLHALVRLLESEDPGQAIVFCRTRQDVNDVTDALMRRKISARSLHGDLKQSERTRTIGDFKQNRFQVLVATDVASRGLDIPDISHVFNFHIPENEERYTHRIGRTGRAGKKGNASILCTPGELRDIGYLIQAKSTQNVKITEIPTKESAHAQLKQRWMESLEGMPISEDARAVCDSLSAEEQQSLLLKLLTAQQSQQKIHGPDSIGYSEKEIKEKIARAGRPRSFQGNRSGGRRGSGRGSYQSSSRGRSGGGGGRGRSRPASRSRY